MLIFLFISSKPFSSKELVLRQGLKQGRWRSVSRERGGGVCLGHDVRNRSPLKLIPFLLNLDKPGSLKWQRRNRFPKKSNGFHLEFRELALDHTLFQRLPSCFHNREFFNFA